MVAPVAIRKPSIEAGDGSSEPAKVLPSGSGTSFGTVLTIDRNTLLQRYREGRVKEGDVIVVTGVTDPADLLAESRSEVASSLIDYIEITPSEAWLKSICQNSFKARSDLDRYIPVELRTKTVILSSRF